jgi:hypothetical protein
VRCLSPRQYGDLSPEHFRGAPRSSVARRAGRIELRFDRAAESVTLRFRPEPDDRFMHQSQLTQSELVSKQSIWVQRRDATEVLTVAAAWRLTLARYTFIHAAAQLLKCLVVLGEAAPKLADQDLIRLLRNIDDHWEDADGPSMTALLKRRPNERPTRVVFSNFRIEIGGLQIQDVVRWANDVDKFVRAEADGDLMPLLHPDDLLTGD